MTLGKRVYWALALVAVMALAGAAITFTSRVTSADEPTPTAAAQPCDQQDDADDARESAGIEADNDAVQDECGDQNEADDVHEAEDSEGQVPAGTLDDGADLLPQASITLDEAVAAAKTAATGDVGEVDLEHDQGKLVFNVDVGDKDVKIDAADGSVLGMASDD